MSNYINLPLSGLEEPLTEMEQVVQDTAHRFAEEVLRPVGAQIDEMSAEDAATSAREKSELAQSSRR